MYHVTIWHPLYVVSNNTGTKGFLMNLICNLIQFVISSITFEIIPTNLNLLFRSDIVLSFVVLPVVFIDNGIMFKNVLVFKALKLYTCYYKF